MVLDTNFIKSYLYLILINEIKFKHKQKNKIHVFNCVCIGFPIIDHGRNIIIADDLK